MDDKHHLPLKAYRQKKLKRNQVPTCLIHSTCKPQIIYFDGSNIQDQERDDLIENAKKEMRSNSHISFISKVKDNVNNLIYKNQIKIEPIKNQGQKLIVSDFSLDHWLAQTYNLDLDNWPKQKPENLSKETYEQLKRIFRKYHQVGPNAIKFPEFTIARLIQQKQQRSESNEVKSDHQSIVNQSTQNQFSKKKSVQYNPVRMQPIIYPLNKAITPFQELFIKDQIKNSNQFRNNSGSEEREDQKSDELTVEENDNSNQSITLEPISILKDIQTKQIKRASKYLVERTNSEFVSKNLSRFEITRVVSRFNTYKKLEPQKSEVILLNQVEKLDEPLRQKQIQNTTIADRRAQRLDDIKNKSLSIFLRKGRDYTSKLQKEQNFPIQETNRRSQRSFSIPYNFIPQKIEIIKNGSLQGLNQSSQKAYGLHQKIQSESSLANLIIKKHCQSTIISEYENNFNTKNIMKPNQSLSGFRTDRNQNKTQQKTADQQQQINQYSNNYLDKENTASTSIQSSIQLTKGDIIQKRNVSSEQKIQVEEKIYEYQVQPEDFNFEIDESKSQYFMPEIEVQLKLHKNDTKSISENVGINADFWLMKGEQIHNKIYGNQVNTNSKENKVALDFYLSGVKTDPSHFKCVYNVGVSFFIEKLYLNALKWFDLAIKIKPQDCDSQFGKSLSCLKLGKFQQALQSIQKLDYRKQQSESLYSSLHQQEQFTMLYTVCCRVMGQHNTAQTLFQSMYLGQRIYQSNKIKNGTCSLILLPLNPNRRKIETFIRNFFEQVQLHSPTQFYDSSVINNLAYIQNPDQTLPQRRNVFLANYLQKFPFLKRLSVDYILKKIQNNEFQIVCFKEKELIPIQDNQDSDVFLNINGKIILQKHTLEKPFEYSALQVVKPGCFLGVSELDMGQSSLPLVFPVVYSYHAHLIKMSKQTFEQLWLQSINHEKQIFMSTISKYDIFNFLSLQTKHRIVYEQSSIRKFEYDHILFQQSVKSAWNEPSVKFYINYKPLVRAEDDSFEHNKNKKNAQQIVNKPLNQSVYIELVTRIVNKNKTKDLNKQKSTEKKKSLRQNIPSFYKPVYIIISGSATVLFKNREGEEFEVQNLRSGDIIGFSELLEIEGFECFGQIVAASSGIPLQCLVIEKPDEVFELYERNLLAQQMSQHTQILKRLMENKFKYLPQNKSIYIKD